MDALLQGRAELSLAAAGVGWVKKLRDSGADRVAERGFPTTRDEEWKYTNVKPIAKRQFRPAGPTGDGVAAADIARCAIDGLTCHRAVFVNGYFSPSLSDLSALPPGVNMDIWIDRSHYLVGRLQMMANNMWQGALLVFIVLSLFLRLKVAMWVVVGIPVTFFGTLFLMPHGPWPRLPRRTCRPGGRPSPWTRGGAGLPHASRRRPWRKDTTCR